MLLFLKIMSLMSLKISQWKLLVELLKSFWLLYYYWNSVSKIWSFGAYTLLAKIQKGDRVLIYGGASGVGTALIQLVRLFEGFSIVTVSTDEKIEFTKQYILNKNKSIIFYLELELMLQLIIRKKPIFLKPLWMPLKVKESILFSIVLVLSGLLW